MKTIEVPPYAPALMESIRAIGYSTEAAVADIIDNSITAGAKKVDIDFFPVDNSYVSILDNGSGMSKDEIIDAMQYGSKNPLEERDSYDLGRYGLGLKTASLSQCRVLTVLSKKNNKVSGCQWDLNHIQEVGSWSLVLLEENEIKVMPNYNKLKKLAQGTIVIWQDLDRMAMGEKSITSAFSNKMMAIRNHISLVFHRYLSGEQGIKKISINMNDEAVLPQDPFLINKSTQILDDEKIIVNGEKVIVKPYILPHISKLTKKELNDLGGNEGLRKTQGFYVYRNKRLIVWGNWFRMMRQGDLSKLARVQVDIPNSLDDLWTLDIKKSTAIPPDEVKKNLGLVIDKICESSKRTWTYRGKKEVNDKIIHIWDRKKERDGSIYYEINFEHPLVNLIIKENPNIKQKLNKLLKQISSNLPLNSLYLDLTSDEKILNEEESEYADIIEMIKLITTDTKNINERINIIQSLKNVEPFCNFSENIDNSIMEGEFNE